MEVLQELFDKWYPVIAPYIALLTPQQWAMAGGGLVVLIVLWRLLRRMSRGKKQGVGSHTAAQAFNSNVNLQVQHVQIAPLGRDAFFKLRNDGDPIILSALSAPNRPDIVIKKAVSGRRLERGDAYAVLLETSAEQRIQPGMMMELTYVDLAGSVHTCRIAMA